jgi:hypothetical protein
LIGQPIVDKIMEHPAAVHLWDDVFHSIVMHPAVLSTIRKIQDGTIQFDGTFLLVANDQEFPDGNFPPFPGVRVDFEDNIVLLEHLERQMRLKQLPESMISHGLRNVAQWKKENERHDNDQ